jgi:hypothetical protein
VRATRFAKELRMAEAALQPIQPLTLLAPGIAAGEPAPDGWRRIDEFPLLIISGLTGVGKSTTLAALAHTPLVYTLLPNRRELTDRLLITYLQWLDGVPIQPVMDRKQRFAYTRRYRTLFPGGMAHLLTQLWIDPAAVGSFLLFDGLRGVAEVGHAVRMLPQAHFLVLHAPDSVRVGRLLGRQDAFDQVADGSPVNTTPLTFADLGILDEGDIFSVTDQAALMALVQQGAISAPDLRAKVQIVLEERQNYDPYAAIALLQTQVAERSLILDTVQFGPEQVVDRLLAQVQAWGMSA